MYLARHPLGVQWQISLQRQHSLAWERWLFRQRSGAEERQRGCWLNQWWNREQIGHWWFRRQELRIRHWDLHCRCIQSIVEFVGYRRKRRRCRLSSHHLRVRRGSQWFRSNKSRLERLSKQQEYRENQKLHRYWDETVKQAQNMVNMDTSSCVPGKDTWPS